MTALALPQPGSSPADALAVLGLEVEDFTEMLVAGHVAARSSTAHDPRNGPGILRYVRQVGTLRQRLVARGWVSGDPRGLATISNPDSDVTLVVCSGDALAGSIDPKHEPRTRYPKGPMYRAAVHTNQQLALGFDGDPADDDASLAGRQTWLALWFASSLEGRCEVSLPANVDDQGFVDRWAHRIVLPPIELGEVAPVDDDEGPDEIDITVEPI